MSRPKIQERMCFYNDSDLGNYNLNGRFIRGAYFYGPCTPSAVNKCNSDRDAGEFDL